jgi:pSer/pThr/pTyr-binding forkhead associated (FHA) protein
MSLSRLVYYSAVIGGWAAFAAWLVAELLILRGNRGGGTMQVVVIAALVGGAIGAGLNVVAGAANAQWKEMLRRALPGLLGGAAGGAVGGLLGNLLYVYVGLPRAFGWMIMGLAIGVVDGLYEGSRSKIRNGLIGGGLGGLVGGFLFDPVSSMAGSDLSGRATAFVILGLCIGALIGIAQVVLKEAWLTVLDGYRAGRQLILSQEITVLGRAEHLPLPFLGTMNRELEAEHARIVRQPNGSYTLEDNHTTLGTRLNGELIQGAVRLKDGDVVKLATNFIRFHERAGRSAEELAESKAAMATTEPASTAAPARPKMPPPPPSRLKSGAATKAPSPPSSASTSSPAPPTTAASTPSPSTPAAAAPSSPKPSFPAPPPSRTPAPPPTGTPAKSGGTIRPVPPRPKLPGQQ